MSYDKTKVDDFTLALLYLVMHNEDESGARAWKLIPKRADSC